MIDDAYVFYALFLFIMIMRFLCRIYSHPLVAGWAPTPLWCRIFRKKILIALSLGGWRWSLLLFVYRFWESLLSRSSDQ